MVFGPQRRGVAHQLRVVAVVEVALMVVDLGGAAVRVPVWQSEENLGDVRLAGEGEYRELMPVDGYGGLLPRIRRAAHLRVRGPVACLARHPVFSLLVCAARDLVGRIARVMNTVRTVLPAWMSCSRSGLRKSRSSSSCATL